MARLSKRLRDQSESHYRSKLQEKETAKRTGGSLTPRSGAGSIKGDVRKKSVLRIENKTSKHASFSVNAEHIDKLTEAVVGTTEIPMMQIELLGGARKFIVIPDKYFDVIIEALSKMHDD